MNIYNNKKFLADMILLSAKTDSEHDNVNDIMYIVEVVERRSQIPFYKFGMSKEIMARLRAKLIWNEG